MEVVRIYRADEQLLPEDQAVWDLVANGPKGVTYTYLVFSASSTMANACANSLAFHGSYWNITPTGLSQTSSVYGVENESVVGWQNL